MSQPYLHFQKSSCCLRSVALSRCGMNFAGMSEIETALSVNQSLTELNLTGSEVGFWEYRKLYISNPVEVWVFFFYTPSPPPTPTPPPHPTSVPQPPQTSVFVGGLQFSCVSVSLLGFVFCFLSG